MQNWIGDEHSRSIVENTIAVLVRVMEQAVRDGIIKVNPARVTGWQKLHDHYRGWGDMVIFAACTAARIGEVSSCRVGDIDTTQWIWTVRRQTTPEPGGHLRRHDLRHTGLTWFADAGVQVHVLRRIAGHGSLTTTQRYLHPDVHKITAAGAALSAHLNVLRARCRARSS
ncbi:tyrosine-type recombinase/integrase [Streptomyces sp. NPDC102462]|uniref:tyrosine-type recombinase/integrase n=1 Tax=Streptomyces sp. NPDC102462 TaxID=3366178 RepID=UPI0037FF7D81